MRGYSMDVRRKTQSFYLANDFNGYLQNHDFLFFIKDCCQLIAENRDKLLEPENDGVLCEMLYYLLNLKPKTKEFQQTYEAMFLGQGQRSLQMAIYKRLFSSELKELFPLIQKTPILYGSPEIDIAEMHFSGAIGLDRKKPTDYPECSEKVKLFSFDAYKQIRAASTHHELQLVHSPNTKLALAHILLGHYIDWYARLLTSVLNRAGYVMDDIEKEDAVNPETRLKSIIERVLTQEEMKAFTSVTTKEVDTNIKKRLLKKKCHDEVLLPLIKFLNDIGFEYKIGYKSCSKKEFAEIVWVIKEYCRVLNITKYKPCKELLTLFYGVPPTQYKVRDCSEFLKTPEGRNLRKKIEVFCMEHERYCYR